MQVEEEHAPENGQCKGPEAGQTVLCSGNGKLASVTEVE